jgi:hypothetical protein
VSVETVVTAHSRFYKVSFDSEKHSARLHDSDVLRDYRSFVLVAQRLPQRQESGHPVARAATSFEDAYRDAKSEDTMSSE